MLHEALLSLWGHPSRVLSSDALVGETSHTISPPERELLASIVHLSELHVDLRRSAADISTSHDSTICRAVANAVVSDDLSAFRRAVLETEERVLRKDSSLVGAYNIVPLTAVVSEFSGWTRRLEWLWRLLQFMAGPTGSEHTSSPCTGAKLIDRLRVELQTGYADLELTASRLLQVAENTWLKQASAWLLYGRLPVATDGKDFFIQQSDHATYTICWPLVPAFVTRLTALSMLFVGKSLNYLHSKGLSSSVPGDTRRITSQLAGLSKLPLPLASTAVSASVASIRMSLSRSTLQRVLPAARVYEVLQLFRDFFLLGRGEFATALARQVDKSLSSRWRRADNQAHEKGNRLGALAVKEGEIAAVLAQTWTSIGSTQGRGADEDLGIDFARNHLRLALAAAAPTTKPVTSDLEPTGLESALNVASPFNNLLFATPVDLTLDVKTPLDLFLSSSDLRAYTIINSFLLSVRRAHIRLTDMWMATSLRRHHPAPPAPPYGNKLGGRQRVRLLRERYTARADAMRRTWATSSAAIFLLAETEAYFQAEIISGLWDSFNSWIRGRSGQSHQAIPKRGAGRVHGDMLSDNAPASEGDMWLATTTSDATSGSRPTDTLGAEESLISHQFPDPETLAIAHRLYIQTVARHLLLNERVYTDAVYEFLVRIDQLVALVSRLHSIWKSMDLEADVGVVDALVDLEQEEREIGGQMEKAEAMVREGLHRIVEALQGLEAKRTTSTGDTELGEPSARASESVGWSEEAVYPQYVPMRVGGVDRLLMKLDFGPGQWLENSE